MPPNRRRTLSETPKQIAKSQEPRQLSRLIEIYEKPGHLIRRLHQISTSVFIEEAKAFDLTQVQYVSLIALDICPGVDQVQLGKIVALDRTTVSVVVRRLVEKRLLDRRKRNGRTSALYVTGPGRAVIQAMRARIGTVDKILLGPLSEAEQGTFMRLLMKVVYTNNQLSRAPHQLIDFEPAQQLHD